MSMEIEELKKGMVTATEQMQKIAQVIAEQKEKVCCLHQIDAISNTSFNPLLAE